MPITTVIFDADDTLLDLRPAVTGGLVAVLEEMRRLTPAAADLRLADLESDWGAVFGELTAEPVAEIRLAALARSLGRAGLVGELRCGLAGEFAFEVYAHVDGVPKKPDPGFYAAVLTAAGSTAAGTVHVGDSLSHDVLGAQATGLPAVWLNRRGAPRPAGVRPEAEVRSLADLPLAMSPGPGISDDLQLRLTDHRECKLGVGRSLVGSGSIAGVPVPDGPPRTANVPRQITSSAPPRPTGLTATAVPGGPPGPVVTLTWTRNSGRSGVQGWLIQRATDSRFTTGLIEVRSGTPDATYDDAAVVPGVTYFYRVRADGTSGEPTWSDPATAVVRMPAPTGLRAVVLVAEPLRVDLCWTGQTPAVAAEVQRAVNPTFTAGVATLAVLGGSSCRDTETEPGTTYYYRVRNLLRGTPSPWSNVATVITPEPPVAPPALTAGLRVGDARGVILTWTKPATSIVAGFVVERADDATFSTATTIADLPPTSRRFNDDGVTAAATYHYRIKAFNAAGSSPYSLPVTITLGG